MAPGELWTSGNICAHYAISRNTLKRWRTKPGFPPPLIWQGRRGGIYERMQVEAWKLDRDRPAAAKRGAALELYRQTGSQRQTAIALGVDRRTIRRWLEELGELDQAAA